MKILYHLITPVACKFILNNLPCHITGKQSRAIIIGNNCVNPRIVFPESLRLTAGIVGDIFGRKACVVVAVFHADYGFLIRRNKEIVFEIYDISGFGFVLGGDYLLISGGDDFVLVVLENESLFGALFIIFWNFCFLISIVSYMYLMIISGF